MPSDVANGSEYKRMEDVAAGNVVEDVAPGNNSGSNTKNGKEICNNDDNNEEPPAKRATRHRRKGIPRRAPFF